VKFRLPIGHQCSGDHDDFARRLADAPPRKAELHIAVTPGYFGDDQFFSPPPLNIGWMTCKSVRPSQPSSPMSISLPFFLLYCPPSKRLAQGLKSLSAGFCLFTEAKDMVTVRGYKSDDEAQLLTLWGAALPYDPIDRRTFHRKVLLDQNFDPDWLVVAEADGQLVGFCLCLIRRVPMEKVGMEPERGWITAFGVHPEWRRKGVGTALLERALQLFCDADRKEIFISPYTPHYFVPGVDERYYAEGLAFLQRHGFEVVGHAISMDANIVLFDDAPYTEREQRLREQGIEVRNLHPNEVVDLMAFLKTHMPGDWVRHARDLLTDITKGLGDYDQFVVAWHEGEIVGYCQFEGEHFGPYGVRSDMQGKGIGTVLMVKCLQTMRRKGLHNAWVLWTSEETAQKVYSRFGFKETRRFAILRKRL
jgi:ribosomal protein S18 acetylase RimI-like enzyme